MEWEAFSNKWRFWKRGNEDRRCKGKGLHISTAKMGIC